MAELLRNEIKKGVRLADVDPEVLKTVKNDLFQFYIFSSKLAGYAHGTSHYSSIWEKIDEKNNTEEKEKI